MKFSLFLMMLCLIFAQSFASASEHPDGNIIFYNASQNHITAQVSTFSKITLTANETKNVAYSSLLKACSANPTNCRAEFYVNNAPTGFAIFNVVTGKVINMNNLFMKIHTSHDLQQVLRSIVIQ